MGIVDRFRERIQNSFSRGGSSAVGEPTPPIESLTKAAPYGLQIEVLRHAAARLDKGEGSDIDRMLVDTMGRAGMQNQGTIWKGQGGSNDRRLESALGENISGYIGINDYGFKGKRQYIADRRYLLDLYVVAYNNADVRTAITHQRNEIFRRGFDWVQSWDYKCPVDDEEFTAIDARKLDYKHTHKTNTEQGVKEVEVPLEQPDEGQKVEFDKFIESCNYFGQSLETILRECWDDVNVVDDAFIFISKEYTAEQQVDKDGQSDGDWEITGKPKFIFRLDPVLVEFDLDQRGIPGMRHHICLLHRDELLEVPPGEGWELEWKGKCPSCNLPTYPTIFKYNECADEKTEFLTRKGWKFGKDLSYDDEFATRTAKGVMEWQHPQALTALDYDGEMVRIKGRYVDLLVTPNHRMLVKDGRTKEGWRFDRAGALPSQFKIPTTAIYVGGTRQEWFTLPYHRTVGSKRHGEEFPERQVKMDDWLEFLGYYLAEGRSTQQIYLAQSPKGKAREGMRAVLDRLEFDYTETDVGFRLREPQVLHYLRPLGVSHEKRVPAEFKDLHWQQTQILVEAYLAGDGGFHPTNTDNGYFASTSNQLAEDMAGFMLKLGFAVSYRTKEFKNPKHRPQRFVHFHRKITEPVLRKHNVSREQYCGKVYCAQVPNGTLFLRRNNKVSITGNSYLQGGYGTAQAKVLYLTAEEVIHWSYYTPSELYGYPPVLSIYEKALTLIGMDRYIYDYFYERKVPQGIISTVTDDPKGIESVKSELQARMQQDPHYIPWIAVSAKTGQGKTEFVRFAYTLDELNYLPVRDEIRERIAGIYGVSAIWMSSVQGIGGLNAESQQLQVMSRVVEGAQRIFHEQVFPSLMQHFGVTDWEMELATPEEDSELAELQIRQSRATWAQTMQAIGFGIEYDQEKDEFTITGNVPSAQEQQQQAMEMDSIMGEQGGEGEGEQPGGGDGAPSPPPPDVGAQLD